MPGENSERLAKAKGAGAGGVAPYQTCGDFLLPRLAMGTYRLYGEQCEQTVTQALALGLRFLDTAAYYENERDVGRALKHSSVPRHEVLVGTKLWYRDLAGKKIKPAVEKALRRLQTDYIDILYPHWFNACVPVPEMMEAFGRLIEQGKVRALAMSNFTLPMMEQVLATGIGPVLGNQVEMHPYLGQRLLHNSFRRGKAFRDKNLALIAYSPLAAGRAPQDATLAEIGEKYSRTAAQVALRWVVQREGVIAVFGGENATQISENIAIFDFELAAEDMGIIDQMTAHGLRLYEHPSMKGKWGRSGRWLAHSPAGAALSPLAGRRGVEREAGASESVPPDCPEQA